MRARLKVLSPIHIGCGESISPSEYFIDKAKGDLNVVNMEGLFRDAGFVRYREKFIKEAGSVRYLGQIIEDQTLLKKHVLYSIPMSLEARASNQIEVKSFIKSAGRPYIPGSSIKGAIISALIYYSLKELYYGSDRGMKDEISKILGFKGNEKSREARDYGDKILNLTYNFLARTKHGEISQGKYIHLLDVSDSGLFSPDKALRIEVCRVQGARSGRQIPVLYETLKEGIETDFELVSRDCRLKEAEIIKVCDEFYHKVASKDGVEVEGQPYLIRLGQGGTAFSTSLLILAEELGFKNYNRRAPRTRKRLIDGHIQKAMGFARILIN